MPPDRHLWRRTGSARPTQDHIRRFAQGCVSRLWGPGKHCLQARETLLRRMTSIAHHAFMSTTGEIARDALVARTGVAP